MATFLTPPDVRCLMPEVIAHRGYAARAPENTLAALRMAIEARADALEFDLHVTRDGIPVLIHDSTLRRTTGVDGRVEERTAAEVQALDAGSWFDEGFAGEPVPTLAQALEFAAPHRSPAGRIARVYPEIKGWRTRDDLGRIAGLLRETGWYADACVISLDWDALVAVREIEPGLAVGFVYDDARLHHEAVELAARIGNAIIDPDVRLLLDDPARAAFALDHRVEIGCWTVDDADDARRIAGMGVHRITTNEVERMVRTLSEDPS